MIIEYLGDVHLGKKFQNGVPLNRRGEREANQYLKFRDNLLNTKADYHVQVGDLFDSHYVSYMTVWGAYQAYKAAVKANPHTKYYVLRGNHDGSRDTDRVSAFDIFEGLVDGLGVIVVSEAPYAFAPGHYLVPWHPFITASEMAEQLPSDARVVVGHWDVVMGDTNRIPIEQFQEIGVKRAITGHDHVKRDLKMGGIDVHVTGSMEPFSHGEDPDGEIYVTLTLQDDLTNLRDKCVRILLKADEVFDQQIECLQLTLQRGEKDQVDLGEIEFEEFDMDQLFMKAASEVGLDDDFTSIVKEKFIEARAQS